jgi:NADPH:quinone reductase-like Zn-dependent oxidoreductase/NAD(P)-dependent dehydrogenase (short-subunit alcohol dehydrogenase family)
MTNREHLAEPYIFGLLPGLSGGISPEFTKNDSPLLTEREWEEMLLQSGFNGFETCISDAGYITEEAVSAIMVSKAVSSSESSKSKVHLIYDDSCPTQTQLLQQMTNESASKTDSHVVPVPWYMAGDHDLVNSVCVFLVDPYGTFLAQLQNDDLMRLKRVFSTAKAFIWITFQPSTKDQSPTEGLVPGLLRTLATENQDCLVVNVNLDAASPEPTAAANIFKVLNAFLQTGEVPEDEYLEHNGELCIPRVIKDDAVSAKVFASDHRVDKPWNQLQQPHLTIGIVGRLNTLHFEQAISPSLGLQPDEVLVEIKAVGLIPRDLAVAQGQIQEEVFGSQFAGVVVETSASSDHGFNVGDRICGIGRDAMSRTMRCKTFQLQNLPPNMGFCEGATQIVALCTAYYSLIHCARLKHGKSVLIHHAAGELGQAMIQLAQLRDCNIYATVKLTEQAVYLADTYNIPRSNIFSLHTDDFSSGIRRLTQGRGVDVVVSSLVGEAVRVSWDCLAQSGCFIDTGIKSSATSLPMGKGRVFFDVDIHEVAKTAEIRAVLYEAMQMIESKKSCPPKQLRVFKQSETFEAFRMLQAERYTGGMVIAIRADEIVEMVLAQKETSLFSSDYTYLLAGAYGGVGQGVARWMVQQGAKNLILPSRCLVDGTGSAREKLVQELRAQGVDVRAPLCDIADKEALRATLQDLDDMPPIKGCIQSAMVLRDSSFANMSVQDWHTSLSPKLAGSWNLHQLLPAELDFFVMFSSSTGIMGSFGQSNYTAGNTYQDALATHRITHGQRAHSIAMSMVIGVGWVAENTQVQALLRVRGMLEEVTLEDIYELLRYCCDPDNAQVGGQIITPLSLPADLRALGIVEPLGSTRPIYSHLHTLPSRYTSNVKPADQPGAKILPSISLQNAATLAEATDIITEAIRMQLSSLLVVSKDDIDPRRPIHMYGVDSLVAVEMKNWFAKGVGVEVGTTEILGGAAMAELAAKVVKSSRFVKDELKIENSGRTNA